MNTYTSKSSERNNRSAANNLADKNTALKLQDNRTQSVVQKKEINTGLPDQLKNGIENLSGHSMDDVKVHYNSDKPAQLNAHAYAQGSDIHLASGQEKHLPHEAWHVVQQKQGRVKPTMQMKEKININDDKRLEQEADIMGDKAFVANNQPVQLMYGRFLRRGIATAVGVGTISSLTRADPRENPSVGPGRDKAVQVLSSCPKGSVGAVMLRPVEILFKILGNSASGEIGNHYYEIKELLNQPATPEKLKEVAHTETIFWHSQSGAAGLLGRSFPESFREYTLKLSLLSEQTTPAE
jgi:hypothetical protein